MFKIRSTRNNALTSSCSYFEKWLSKLKVNALLDDASTQTYVNADVAAEVGLTGTFETIKVSCF